MPSSGLGVHRHGEDIQESDLLADTHQGEEGAHRARVRCSTALQTAGDPQ